RRPGRGGGREAGARQPAGLGDGGRHDRGGGRRPARAAGGADRLREAPAERSRDRLPPRPEPGPGAVRHPDDYRRSERGPEEMSAWLVRHEGTTTAVSVPAAAEVLAGLRDGTWLATDEVKGPDDQEWRPIEAHPAFEEAAADLEEPPAEHPDETHLDMNPLIDVCLVLLIFFILTITYESLRRAIDVPETVGEKETKPKPIDYKSIQDRVVLIQAKMNGDTPVIRIGGEEAAVANLVEVLGKHMAGQRKDVILDLDDF